jgi:hypothetical protein
VTTLLAIGLVLGLVRVEGTAQCPSPDEVTRALASMPGTSQAGYIARLSAADAGLLVELVDEQGRVLRTRTLAGSAPCDELAAAAAVIISAWLGELRPPPAAAVPLRRRPRPSPVRWEIGAGFVAGLTGTSFAPGGILDAQVAPRHGRFGGRIALLGAAPRELSLGAGQARYARPMVQLGPDVRFEPWRMLLDLHAEASLAVLIVEGQGFTTSQRDLDIDVGLGGGARAAIRIGPVAPFLGVSVLGWLRDQQVQVTGLGERASLPRYELSFLAGVAFGVFR